MEQVYFVNSLDDDLPLCHSRCRTSNPNFVHAPSILGLLKQGAHIELRYSNGFGEIRVPAYFLELDTILSLNRLIIYRNRRDKDDIEWFNPDDLEIAMIDN